MLFGLVMILDSRDNVSKLIKQNRIFGFLKLRVSRWK